jgi:hypothetical protein
MNAAGFEPTTSASGGQRSIQLSYASKSSVCYGQKPFLSIEDGKSCGKLYIKILVETARFEHNMSHVKNV